jgi:MHS family proline/betaine transporter-like MFS transporter
LFGLLIALAGLWMRRTLRDSPAFSRAAADSAGRRRPMADLTVLFGAHWPGLARAAGLSILLTVASYVLVIFMPVYVQRTFHFSARQAFAAALVGNVLLAGACIGSGALSDRFGRRVVLLSATVALGVCGYPLLWLLQASHTLPTLVLVQSLFCIATGAFAGPAPAALAESFPASSRSIGVSVSYNLAVTVFSGFAPAALTWIAASGGGALAPAWYLTFAAILAAPAALSA